MKAYRHLLVLVAMLVLSFSWAPRGYGGGHGDSITHADAVGRIACRRLACQLDGVSEWLDDDLAGDCPLPVPRASEQRDGAAAGRMAVTGRPSDALADGSGLLARARGPPARHA